MAHHMESLHADHLGCRRPLFSVKEVWSLLLKLASIKCSIISTYNLTGYSKSTLNSQDSSVSNYFAAFYYYCALEVIYVYLSVGKHCVSVYLVCICVGKHCCHHSSLSKAASIVAIIARNWPQGQYLECRNNKILQLRALFSNRLLKLVVKNLPA